LLRHVPRVSLLPYTTLFRSFCGPGIRRHSSGVSRGRCTSCMVVETWLANPRPERVTCSLTIVVWPVSFERCSAVSSRFGGKAVRSEEHTSELQSPDQLVCRL